jgi:ABC-type lipoprotein release transport system permease subunit
VSPLDPIAFAAVAAIVLLSALAAIYRPARRASRIDPGVTLRAD